ncbi:SDR family oxidoreductase [Acidimicrobiia bacterium EGI L10123]|uniref:SDR family NAD(P)-dependent oxidoreductase n=1 Tax=Salinilacustrithrix flava TaxID=2957203 RepID=UPI003D7C3443|nr:SDR family oxidoreductase [Acidimicrobiia bacterium EGI L10123]
MQLHDASVLVAGASGGLGAPICRQLAGAGARLTLLARTEVRLGAMAAELGTDAVVFAGDIRSSEDCGAAVAAAVDAHGRLDAVVAATGVVAFGSVVDLDDAVLDELITTNLVGPLRLARAAIPHLPDGGCIVNISAVVAENPVAGMGAYSASKAALTSLDVSLGRELRRQRITVLDVRPPHTETGLADRPIAGEAPKLPQGLDPAAVAARIVEAMAAGERDLPSSAFSAD